MTPLLIIVIVSLSQRISTKHCMFEYSEPKPEEEEEEEDEYCTLLPCLPRIKISYPEKWASLISNLKTLNAHYKTSSV